MAERHNSGLGRWVRLAAGYHLDPKIIRAGKFAELVYVRGLSFARMTGADGHIAREHYRELTRDLRPRDARAALDALLTSNLWEPCDDGWRVPLDRWARWQDTTEDRLSQTEAERQRKADYRERKRKEQEAAEQAKR